MCGIWGIVGEQPSIHHQRQFMKIIGRGPDLTVLTQVQPNVHLGFHRLAIVLPVDVPSKQPIVGCGLAVVCNGEIYNHMDLKNGLGLALENGGSDCAAVIHSFVKSGGDLRETCASLDGVFAFLMADEKNLYIGRDPIGVRPLFYGFTTNGSLVMGSEVKSIDQLVEKIDFFPPGCCATVPLNNKERTIQIQQYYEVPSVADRFTSMDMAQSLVQHTLISSIEKRLMSDRKVGFLLSGGLDSSLIASIATKYLTHKPVAFSVGFDDSPDLINARRVAEYLNIEHHVLVITPQECIDVVPEVIYALETFDPFIIRCGLAHYLLCRHIAQISDVKVLLSGEGADELFGSYVYMQNAPDASQLHRETLRRMHHLHQYDVLRCDRATSCHGLEIRVPFLDKEFIDLVARLPPNLKMVPTKLEKFVLRAAFADWLPEEVLWRSKDGFSNALGKVDLSEVIGQHACTRVSEEQFALRFERFPDRTPETKEEFWYREIFENTYQYAKIADVIHTKVYRTAAWHQVEEKDSVKLEMRDLGLVRPEHLI